MKKILNWLSQLLNQFLIQIPKNHKFIDDSWIDSSLNISEIEVSPKNKHFSYVENKFLVGKSSEDSETFDTLYFTKDCTDEVVIPPYIKFVTNYSFLNCHKSIIFPPDSKLKEIKKDTRVAYSVERLVLLGTFENIHPSFFSSLYKIKEISITGENKNYTIIENKFLVKKKTNTSLNFDELAFLFRRDCEVIIPPEIKYVNEYSLYRAQKLKSVIFPSNSQLKIIENNSIYPNCLERLIIPGCVENIFGNNFFSFDKLTELQINGECKNYYLFDNKILLKKNDEFDEIIFAVKNIESATIPSSVKTISSYAFYNCKQLTEITFSSNSSLEKICQSAFYQCPIEKFIFPETVQYVEEKAFMNNENLISVQFNSQNINIQMCCFSNCPNLEVISFPNATDIYFDFYDFKIPDEVEIHVRRDVKLSGYFSQYKEYIKYVFGPEEAEIVKYDEPKIKPVIPIEHRIETKLPPIKKYIPKSDTDETIEQRKEQNRQQSKRLEIYLKHIRFLEQRLSKYERVIPFDPSTNNQNEETDYESEEKQVNTTQNINFFMDDSDEEGHEIVSKIGEGNSSIAYKVIDHQHKRVLCKKVLKEKEYETVFPEFQKKMKEIEVLNQDRHPSICEVIGVNIEGRYESESDNESEDKKEKEKGSFEEEDNDDDDDDKKEVKEGKKHKIASF